MVAGAGHRALTVAPQSGVTVLAGAGELVRVVDVEGRQVGDMWVIDAADPGRWLSASHTRDRCERLFPHGGERFCVAASGAGDAISFRTLRDAVFVLTACSVDYPPLNGGRCGPLRIEFTPAPAR